MARCPRTTRETASRVWRVLTFVLLSVLAWPLPAQIHPPLVNYFRETWTTREGLPHNQVNAIVQTPDGYLWFATWEGLVRYNGHEFELFERSNTPALRDNGIRSITSTGDGALVIGTSRGGVSVLRRGAWSHFGKAEGLAQDEVMAAALDPRGRLWVASESAGVSRLDGGQHRQFGLAEGLPSLQTWGLFLDRQGAVWVPGSEGLTRIVGDSVDSFGVADGLPAGDAFCIIESGDGGYYVGTAHGVYHGVDGRFARLDPRIPDDAVISLQRDVDGDLWIGTVNHGLLRLGDEGLESLSAVGGFPYTRIAALRVDREGSLWAGTTAGLLRLRDAPFTTIGREHGLSDDYIRAILAARDGSLWIGSSRGLNHWRDGKVKTYTQADGLPGDSILSLYEDVDGSLWAGTYASGLLHLRDGRIEQVYDRGNGLPSNQVRAVVGMANGSLWVGTNGGLVRILHGQLTRFGTEHGLPRDYILSLHAARDGSLWIGTANGPARFHEGRIDAPDVHRFDEVQDVFGFLETAAGDIWMTTDRGLLRWRKGRIGHVGLGEGIPIDTLFGLVEDDAGYFWASSNRGILRLSHADADRLADGRGGGLDIERFGEGDGMASAQCNGGSNPPATRAADGSLWFATAKGAAQMRPARLAQFRRTPPPVVIERVRVDDRELPAQSELELPAGTRKLEIQFAGLSYQFARQLRYRSRLEGFDSDWVEHGELRSVQFTNLKPGAYLFRVSAANPGAAWQPHEARLGIRILPAWWQRPDLQVGALVALLGGLFLYWRWRHLQIAAREQLLRGMVEQRTLDLRRQTDLLLQADLEKSRLVEQLREQSEAFERQAREDGLTGIANRRSMDEHLGRSFERAQRGGMPLCFALLDLDLFKQVNDEHGHAAGDIVLREVARVLRERVRGSDWVARWGGEEFALLFPDTERAIACSRCEQIRQAVAALEFEGEARGVRITVSIGVAEREGVNHPHRLVTRADQRLYEAKSAGRNRVVC